MNKAALNVAGHAVSPLHYINGERVGSPDTFELFSPIDQRVLGQIAQATPEKMASAVTAASAAFPAWSQLTAAARRCTARDVESHLLR